MICGCLKWGIPGRRLQSCAAQHFNQQQKAHGFCLQVVKKAPLQTGRCLGIFGSRHVACRKGRARPAFVDVTVDLWDEGRMHQSEGKLI